MRKYLLILFLFINFFSFGQLVSSNNKLILDQYKRIPNNISAWTAGTGTYINGSDGNRNYIECTVAGTTYISSTQAYGEWYFDIYNQSSVADLSICFISTDIDFATQTGYRYFTRIGGTPAHNIQRRISGAYFLMYSITSIIANKWYSIKIERSLAGVFNTYIRRNEFGSTWVLLGTATENTNTTSNYYLINLAAGDRISNVIFKDTNSPIYNIIK